MSLSDRGLDAPGGAEGDDAFDGSVERCGEAFGTERKPKSVAVFGGETGVDKDIQSWALITNMLQLIGYESQTSWLGVITNML